MLTISWWVASVIVIFIAPIFYVFGYRRCEKEQDVELTKKIIEEQKITCLMVTHNMQQALDLGNRLLMMDSGRIVFDVKDEEKKKMTTADLLEQFKIHAGKSLDNDRILLSGVSET